MTYTPMTFKAWAEQGEYPSLNVLYNWTRPGETCDQMVRAGVIVRVNNRWLFNPTKWLAFCEQSAAA